jgi:hypothetical protein
MSTHRSRLPRDKLAPYGSLETVQLPHGTLLVHLTPRDTAATRAVATR